MANLIEEMDGNIEEKKRSIEEKNARIHQLSQSLNRERTVIRLHNFLTTCLCSQEFLICAPGNNGKNILLARGTKQEITENDEYRSNLMEHIGDAVQYWTVMADGIFVQLEKQKGEKI